MLAVENVCHVRIVVFMFMAVSNAVSRGQYCLHELGLPGRLGTCVADYGKIDTIVSWGICGNRDKVESCYQNSSVLTSLVASG